MDYEKYVKDMSEKLRNLLGSIVDGRTTVKLISRKDGVRLWTGFSWYEIASTGRLT